MKKAAATRQVLLQKAFELIYVRGYQATSIDDILTNTVVTKGAFYYHFKNKDEMGLAIIEEVLKPTLTGALQGPSREDDPLETVYRLIHDLLMKNPFLKVEYGCPASNLTQEMTPWNQAFTEALEGVTAAWESHLVQLLEKGKKAGYVRKDVRSKPVALFILSGYWGVRNFGKLANSRVVYKPFLKELRAYLNSLK